MVLNFLSPQEFAAEYAPTAQDQQQVVDYLQHLGLRVTSVAPNGLLIDAEATVGQAETGFFVDDVDVQAS